MMEQGELRIEISNPQSNTGAVWVEVTIRDAASGETLARFKADRHDWYGALLGGVLRVDGQWSPNLHRVGKTMRNEQVHIGRSPFWDKDAEAWAWGEARKHEHAKTAETIEVRNTNAGYVAIYRWWEDA